MRVILDTNVLLSALLSPLGSPAKLLDAWERKRFTLVACHPLVAEFRDVASRPFFKARLRGSTVELLAAGLLDFSLFCTDLTRGPTAPDAKDSYLLVLAEASHADFLVTGDKELLALKRHKSTRFITPASMVDILKTQED
ncbi:MAG TPA: putative toxin-antitoxin system toxin component, PIN family [Candidatus Dormibacteraeota bacterium]|nr:putative toxin-antitoxin system toxin component, PIN family [Candidatus Dormibacteraeota bacterium]